MKICFLMISHWSGNLGGAEVQVRYIIDYIREHTDHEVVYIARKANTEIDHGYKVHKLKYHKFWGKFTKMIDYFQVMRILKKEKPDVIYNRVSCAYLGMAASYAKKRDTKLLYHIAHEEDLYNVFPKKIGQLIRYFEKEYYFWGLKQTDAIIGQAKYQDILLEKKMNKNCSAIISNFHPLATQKSKYPEKVKIIWVANIKKIKQPELFIDLAKALESIPHAEFYMIGALQSEKEYGPLIKNTELNNFTYMGKVPLDEVNDLLNDSHIFVNTSVSEGFPNTFIQAWMRRVPVVSLNVDPDNVISNHQLGFYSGNFDQMTQDVEKLIQDVSLREEMGEKAREFAEENFSVKNCGKIVELMGAN